MTEQLDHSPADCIRQLLIDLLLGTDHEDESSWPVFVHEEPNPRANDGTVLVPGNLIVVTDERGVKDARLNPTGETAQHQGIMIRIRANTYPVGYAKANEIMNSLSEDVFRVSVDVDASEYLVQSITITSGVICPGKMRPKIAGLEEFLINALVCLEQTA